MAVYRAIALAPELAEEWKWGTGVAPHQYVIRRRVERARSLLGANDLSISQIAAETGFAHQSHLAHHMQRMLGVTPKALRELLR